MSFYLDRNVNVVVTRLDENHTGDVPHDESATDVDSHVNRWLLTGVDVQHKTDSELVKMLARHDSSLYAGGYQCSHDWDCCGCGFCGAPDVHRWTVYKHSGEQQVMVTQGWQRNV